MCGIAGILHYQPQTPEKWRIEKMSAAMEHRGPDGNGSFSDEHIQLGHRRLSIIDLSQQAAQPMITTDNRYVIVFNGEIYNFKELRSSLPHFNFQTCSDTEVILAAYITWKADCVHYLKGMFAFAIWDTEEKELFMARDRVGVKPLYLYFGKNFMVFASEVRAMMNSGLIPGELNKAALWEYLSFQSIGVPISIIKGVFQLDAGSVMIIRKGRISKFRYWEPMPAKSDFNHADLQLTKKNIHDLLFRAVEKRLVSDVQVGALLSGGIDSAAVVAIMARLTSVPVETFTIGLEDAAFDESPFAAMVAKKYNTSHHPIILKPRDLLDQLPEALNSVDMPSGDGINTWIVSKAIRQAGVKVALSGVGGDELFAGYPFFKQFLKAQKLDGVWNKTTWIRKTLGGILKLSSSGKMERLARLIDAPDCSVSYFYPECRRILTPGQLSKTTSFSHSYDCLIGDRLLNLRDELSTLPLLSQITVADLMGYTQNTLLKDIDQMSMAVSLEIREPFFDYDLIEFLLRVPDHVKYPTYPKSLMVESLNGMIPDEIVHRRKQGFVFPWEKWMRTELRSFCETYINRISQRQIIRPEGLQKLWKGFLKGDPSCRWIDIWLFVVLEYWLERNNIN
ncbi:MAG: asparagine synthase (glutamine-hydrolyzing) [Pseudobacter sp.]|uniref:asparagine synthase (glutamine-hydrolyzing) n=1 Tax=Pseudobacter sp. TaxID=2045420 RepID=UPI003F7F300E